MSINFALEFRGDHIHIQHPPDYEITPKGQEKLWAELAEACKKYDCRRLLAEASTPPRRRMGTVDAFESAGRAVQSAPGVSLACCFPGYKSDETTEFYKTAAYNRGVRVEFFSSRDEALKWLGIERSEPQDG